MTARIQESPTVRLNVLSGFIWFLHNDYNRKFMEIIEFYRL